MNEKDYKEILRQQMELLAEQSKNIKNDGLLSEAERARLLINIAHAMTLIYDRLSEDEKII